MISYLWILRWALAMSYTSWILSRNFSAIDFILKKSIDYIYYTTVPLCLRYTTNVDDEKKNVLTKKKYFDGYLLYIPKVNYRRRGIFFFLNAVLRKIYPLVLSHHYFRQLKSSKTTANYYVHHSLLSKILHVLLRN